MLYDVRHVTTYAYGKPAPFARCVLRVFPRDEPGQRVISTDLVLDPTAGERRDGVCFFGNKVTTITVDRPHRSLTVDVRSRVEVLAGAMPGFSLSPAWEDVRSEAMDTAMLDAGSPAHFIYPSRLAPLAREVTGYAAQSFPPGRSAIDGARDLMGRIRRDFKYDPKATVVSTPLVEAFKKKAGVCQDFAHVMIAGQRGLGLPASYVSGYLRTIPPPGRKRLEGADASHAWVAVWCGGAAGWIGLDPTNDLVAAEDHIVIARGRDYADVSPISGVIIGAGEQSIDVKVDVLPVE